jgi:L-alanine-DL-glutamate epimerase-like enolase superfamily enzyme
MITSRRSALMAGALGLWGTTGPASARSVHPPRRDDQGLLRFPADPQPPLDLSEVAPEPIVLRALELWRTPQEGTILVRAVSADGVEGVVRASTKAEETLEFFRLFVMPKFIGEDMRDLYRILERGYRDDYEYASVPWWSAMGQAEVAVWDLIGKTVGKPCHALMGPKLRDEIPVYLSSNKRDTRPEEEVDHLRQRVEETGCRAIKIKVGRRMGRNTDMYEGRSEAMVRAVREAFGDDMTIYADANGAYDAPTALEVCRMLQSYGVAMLEEPCPFEAFEMARQVTERTDLLIAGGENDCAFEKWAWYCDNRAYDVLQPDPMYNGGMMRCVAVQQMSEAASLLYNPHFPRNNADTSPLLHLCAVAPNLYGFQEYRSRPDALDFAHSPQLTPRGGMLPVSDAPGFGIAYDPSIWSTATRILPQ